MFAPFIKLASGLDFTAAGALPVGRRLKRLTVLDDMITLVGKQFQVFNAVIQLISIFVVDNFTTQQFSAKVLFHDKAVFKDLFTIDVKHSISAPVDSASLVAVVQFAPDGLSTAFFGTKPLPAIF